MRAVLQAVAGAVEQAFSITAGPPCHTPVWWPPPQDACLGRTFARHRRAPNFQAHDIEIKIVLSDNDGDLLWPLKVTQRDARLERLLSDNHRVNTVCASLLSGATLWWARSRQPPL